MFWLFPDLLIAGVSAEERIITQQLASHEEIHVLD